MYDSRLLATAAAAIAMTTFSYVANAWENVNTNMVVYWVRNPRSSILASCRI